MNAEIHALSCAIEAMGKGTKEGLILITAHLEALNARVDMLYQQHNVIVRRIEQLESNISDN